MNCCMFFSLNRLRFKENMQWDRGQPASRHPRRLLRSWKPGSTALCVAFRSTVRRPAKCRQFR
ncbi:hypothetical protein CO661_19000 [Sinorhizobium fredii]|uniref:Uncharacterized protein n=1 Tax=Rhizobium fredii TaxID=380 RepID=A0A2A6LVY0_RHIFR|nr:hypothetical protein CO661_19000 [Sinorhizobium fredii]